MRSLTHYLSTPHILARYFRALTPTVFASRLLNVVAGFIAPWRRKQRVNLASFSEKIIKGWFDLFCRPALLTPVFLALLLIVTFSTYAASILWSSSGGSAWLTGTNWTGNAVPSGTDVAQFGANPTSGTTGVGINMNNPTNNGTNNQAIGAIEVTSARAASLLIGNSTTVVSGTLTLNGASVNSVPNVIVRNNSSQNFTIQDTQGGGNKTMDVALGNITDNIINIDSTGGVTISSVIKNGVGSNLTRDGAGSGILMLSGANIYTGTTTVSKGTLKAGAASVANVSGAFGNNSAVSLANAGGATLDITGFNTQIGSLTGGGATGGNITLGAATLTIGGDNSSPAPYAGVLSGTGGAVTKIGTGTLTLSGTNTYTGATTVNAGTLLVTGSTAAASAVTVNSTGTLGGTGTVNGSVTVNSGGTLAPGLSPGVLNSGSTSLASGSNFTVEITGDQAAGNANGYDQLNVNGAVTISSATLSLDFTGLTSGELTAGQTFVIINNDSNDAVTGTFTGLAEGATVATNVAGSNKNLTISYVGGANSNDVTLTVANAPTAVQMIELSAQVKATSGSTVRGKGAQRGAVINWRTGYEVDNLGFNLYRDEQGQRVKLNPSLIAGSALFAGAHTPLTAGQSYLWSDSAGDQGTRYWLEEIDLSGASIWHGPVTATQIVNTPLPNRAEKALLVEDLNQGANETPQSEFVVGRFGDEEMERLSAPDQRAWVAPNQNAVKLPVRRAGWYRVTRQELAATGFNANIEPELLQLFADGVEMPMRVVNATPGQFVTGDCIEFYGTGADAPTTDTRVYWLVASKTLGQRIPTTATRETAATVSGFVSTVERKDRIIYFSGLLNGAADNWFGPVINATGATQLLTTRFVERGAGGSATLEAVLQGVTAPGHTVEVSVNGTVVGTLTFANKERAVRQLEVATSLLLEGDNAVVFKATGGSSDISLVETVRLSYPRRYVTDDNPFSFSVAAGQTAAVSGFRAPGVRVLQISNGGALREISVRVQPQNGSYGFVLRSENDATYLAYPTARFDRVLNATLNQLSNWRDPNKAAQFLIVTHKDFAASAQRLALARQQQGWQVVVVDVEDAYDEFAFGAHSPQAIKDLLTFARNNWSRPPSHVLLIGAASTDPRNYLALGNVDFMPTQLGETAYFETALDNWLGDSDGDGLPELALGRLPVRTAAQADAVVTKLLGASINPANRSAVLVSDRTVEGFDFRAVSQQLAGLLPAGLTKQHINRNDGTLDTVRAAIIQAINAPGKAPLVVNWLGHGSTQVWTGDGLLRAQDAPALVNSPPALFTMTTCLNGYFVDPSQVSLGEAVLMNAPGGAFAVIASTALNQPATQINFNQQLYQGLFAQGLTLGEALKKARAVVADQDVRNSYVLFGDPTMRLASQESKKE